MGPACWNAVKYILVAGIPIQKLVSKTGDTHLFCNCQAIKILKKDGEKSFACIANSYIEFLNMGVLWADKGWKNFSHYYNPITDNGIGPWPDAKTECRHFFKKAVYYWNKGNKRKSFFFLGAAVHLVQDLCVPHHAKGIVFSGHSDYENWVQNNYFDFHSNHDGFYKSFEDPGLWVEHNAKIAEKYFPYVANSGSHTSYGVATEVLLPLAQKTTAGYFYHFFNFIKYKNSSKYFCDF